MSRLAAIVAAASAFAFGGRAIVGRWASDGRGLNPSFYGVHRRRTRSVISVLEGGFSPRPRVWSASWMRVATAQARLRRATMANSYGQT